jgi:hypothetical protein
MVKYLSDFTKICLINKSDLFKNESILIFKVVIEIEFYANNIIYILYIVMVFGQQQSMFFQANYPFRPTNTKNKRMCGVNQKVTPGLSSVLNMNKNNYQGSVNRQVNVKRVYIS